jgi:hypothetical protein
MLRILDVHDPPASIRPNGRLGWQAKYAITKRYAGEIEAMAREIGGAPFARCWGFIVSHGKSDADNALAAIKPAIDALRRAGWYEDDNPGCIRIWACCAFPESKEDGLTLYVTDDSAQWLEIARRAMEMVRVTEVSGIAG